MKIVAAKVRNSEPAKVWLNMRRAIAMGISDGRREFWTASMGLRQVRVSMDSRGGRTTRTYHLETDTTSGSPDDLVSDPLPS